ncbi:hypothetical protein MNEG_8627 [Monoraphidium neglectum]|uniref:Uncharacterized protein n=1 Tax=Monoraphidium neglectum TaxID=145388 RepID=A0A0D2JJ47_9CHLO|nr:hypothetical protein MNEG_8627 [Monoraphidium neglectum]KIY99332.1 hypothetical protein MNEG_8627 [Monoraphidium neglectum]|eukprot:XP_013898352.1 hypothetical protein MNEG_8627 [Monoraphidium neglectum]
MAYYHDKYRFEERPSSRERSGEWQPEWLPAYNWRGQRQYMIKAYDDYAREYEDIYVRSVCELRRKGYKGSGQKKWWADLLGCVTCTTVYG